jgi:hypothetical protein
VAGAPSSLALAAGTDAGPWIARHRLSVTGSTEDGRVFPANLNLTCNNWSSSTFGSVMLGHIDRSPKTAANLQSWNAAHMSRSCSQPDLVATGGNGLFYCFAQ